jgi:hypothetical protein
MRRVNGITDFGQKIRKKMKAKAIRQEIGKMQEKKLRKKISA